MLSQVWYPLILGTVLRHYWAKMVPCSDFKALLLKETIITKVFEPKTVGKNVPTWGFQCLKMGTITPWSLVRRKQLKIEK